MFRLLKVSAVVGLLATWGAAEAQADVTRVWDTYCGGTAFKTCASVHLIAKGGSQPSIVLFIQNHAGAYGSQPGAILSGIGLRNLPTDVNASLLGGATFTGGTDVATMTGKYRGSSSPDVWRVFNDKNLDGQAFDVATVWNWNAASGGSDGISNSCFNADGTWASTEPGCDATALSGSDPNATYPGFIRIKFYVNRALTEAEVRALELGVRGQYGTTASLCVGAECVSAVPEPVTMLLLGTGLAGIGGAGLLRRRRQNGYVANG